MPLTLSTVAALVLLLRTVPLHVLVVFSAFRKPTPALFADDVLLLWVWVLGLHMQPQDIFGRCALFADGTLKGSLVCMVLHVLYRLGDYPPPATTAPDVRVHLVLCPEVCPHLLHRVQFRCTQVTVEETHFQHLPLQFLFLLPGTDRVSESLLLRRFLFKGTPWLDTGGRGLGHSFLFYELFLFLLDRDEYFLIFRWDFFWVLRFVLLVIVRVFKETFRKVFYWRFRFGFNTS